MDEERKVCATAAVYDIFYRYVGSQGAELFAFSGGENSRVKISPAVALEIYNSEIGSHRFREGKFTFIIIILLHII